VPIPRLLALELSAAVKRRAAPGATPAAAILERLEEARKQQMLPSFEDPLSVNRH